MGRVGVRVGHLCVICPISVSAPVSGAVSGVVSGAVSGVVSGDYMLSLRLLLSPASYPCILSLYPISVSFPWPSLRSRRMICVQYASGGRGRGRVGVGVGVGDRVGVGDYMLSFQLLFQGQLSTGYPQLWKTFWEWVWVCVFGVCPPCMQNINLSLPWK